MTKEKLLEALKPVLEAVDQKTKQDPDLNKLFHNCYPNTLETTTKILEDGTPFIFTGDIPAMWLRDSSAQVRHYLPLCSKSKDLSDLVAGLIQKYAMYIAIDPYANAFNETDNGHGYNQEDKTLHNPWVWERKYEIDSLCYPIQLSYLFWKETGRTDFFDQNYLKAIEIIVKQWRCEQDHMANSPYIFERFDCVPSDTLPHEGKGNPVVPTGMTWSGFRPSDDACKYGYLVPANMFAVVVLGYMAEITGEIYQNTALKETILQLRQEIDDGIQKHAIVEHETFGEIYAYEVDGQGNFNLMDDANVPNLLSIPYLGYCSLEDPIYQNTRAFILSQENPYYYSGSVLKGIGSPHTPEQYVWSIALSMQGLTSQSEAERAELIELLKSCHAGTFFMHEGVEVNHPEQFTRSWFAWANSIFSEFVLDYLNI